MSARENAPFHGLLVPGLHGSDPDHWQQRWQTHLPWLHSLTLPDWQNTELAFWLDRLDLAADALPSPFVLIAHGFGCVAAAHWTATRPRRVAGLLLVAPALPETSPRRLPAPLTVPARLVASTSDPWMSLDEARRLARDWGCAFRNGGDLGHINSASGIGEWRRGFEDLRWLLSQRVSRGTALTG